MSWGCVSGVKMHFHRLSGGAFRVTRATGESTRFRCLKSSVIHWAGNLLCSYRAISWLTRTHNVSDCVWNVMAHAQKPDFVFRRNGRVHLNRRGASVQSTTGSRGVRISGSNAGYIMFRGSVKSTGYPLHSPDSPSLPLPCVTVCHHISTGLWFFHALTQRIFESQKSAISILLVTILIYYMLFRN